MGEEGVVQILLIAATVGREVKKGRQQQRPKRNSRNTRRKLAICWCR